MQHTQDTKAVSINGSYTPKNAQQGFCIVSTDTDDKKNYLSRTEANASFMYNGFMISMSTSGLNHGACLSEVLVMEYKENSNYADTVHTCHSVEDAIKWVNNQTVSKLETFDVEYVSSTETDILASDNGRFVQFKDLKQIL